LSGALDGVGVEAVGAFGIVNALLEKLGGDHMAEIVERVEAYRKEGG
jgi:chorismate synthase